MRSESRSHPGQVPCRLFIKSQRSGAGAGAAGAWARPVSEGVASACPKDKAVVKNRAANIPGPLIWEKVSRSLPGRDSRGPTPACLVTSPTLPWDYRRDRGLGCNSKRGAFIPRAFWGPKGGKTHPDRGLGGAASFGGFWRFFCAHFLRFATHLRRPPVSMTSARHAGAFCPAYCGDVGWTCCT